MTSVQIKADQETLVSWMESPLYKARQAQLALDFNSNSEQILGLVPDSEINVSCLLQLHGARQMILAAQNEFEVMRDNLDLKLRETLEQENARN